LVSLALLGACGEEPAQEPDATPDAAREGGQAGDPGGEEPGEEPGGNGEEEPGGEEPGGEEPEPVAPCAGAADCVEAFPALIADTTVGGAREWGAYGCAPETNEGGPERVYRVVLPHDGFFAAQIRGEPAGVDVDVHVLSARDADACLDRGHRAAGGFLEAGEYWVVADTWVDDEGTEYAGAFELALNLVTPDDLAAHGMKPEVAEDALTAFSIAWDRGETRRLEYTIADFSIHSRLERQWVVGLATGELLFEVHVGHGERSIEGDDLGVASVFSNVPQSHQSSLGLMKTAETYTGDYGYSMRLDGLEAGFNDNVRARDIVVHPWNGNHPDVIAERGWVVPSWGCPTLDRSISTAMIDTISGGALMFFWYPDPTWRMGSTYL
jgi:hypothetical protein